MSVIAAHLRIFAEDGSHTCVILASRQVKCWGENAEGQLGDGGTTWVWSPSQITTPVAVTGVVAIQLGSHHSCAALDNGEIWCWGSNINGRLGSGGTYSGGASGTASLAPVLVAGSDGTWRTPECRAP